MSFVENYYFFDSTQSGKNFLNKIVFPMIFWLERKYQSNISKHVVIVSSYIIFNELLWSDFFDSLPQSFQSFRIKRFKASAKIGLFKMVGFEILCLFRIHFSQVFIMRSIDWNFFICFQLVILVYKVWKESSWIIELFFKIKEDIEALREAWSESDKEVVIDKFLDFLFIEFESDGTSYKI